MRALDPRLLKYAKATRSFLAFSAVNGLVNTALIILQALIKNKTFYWKTNYWIHLTVEID